MARLARRSKDTEPARKSRFPVRRVLVAAALVLVATVIMLFRANSTLTNRYKEVHDGMTRPQVEKLLGPPEEVKLFGALRQVVTWREYPEEAVVDFRRAAAGAELTADGKSFRMIGTPGWRWHVRRWFEMW